MSTTSLKLSDELKQRASSAAKELGVSPHAFMVSAIDQAVLLAEKRLAFLAEAKRSRESLIESDRGYDADEVHVYLKERIAGAKVPRPRASTWRA